MSTLFLKTAIKNEIFKKSDDYVARRNAHSSLSRIKSSNSIGSIAEDKVYRTPEKAKSASITNKDRKDVRDATVKSTQELTALNRPMERTLFSRASSKSASSINTVNSRKASATSGIYNLDCLINDIINRKFKKVLVLTGAGISTPSGIPDFRTPGTGIYDNLEKFKVPYPEAIFEKEYFRRNPRPFFKIAKDLLPNKKQYKPNKIHYFIRLLQEKKILHRLYTQNIDNLETLAGIRPDKLVEAHGSFKSAKCTKCSNEYPAEYAEAAILEDRIPICNICFGIVKPNIVFFGEDLPESFYRMYKRDFSVADLIIVLGTSLKVEPFGSIIDECPKSVPRVLMNKHLVGPWKSKKLGKKDISILGDLIECLDMLMISVGWDEELKQLTARELDILTKKIEIEEEQKEKLKKLSLIKRNDILSLKKQTAKEEKSESNNFEKKQETSSEKSKKLEIVEKAIKNFSTSLSDQPSDPSPVILEIKTHSQLDLPSATADSTTTKIGALGNIQLLPKRHQSVKEVKENLNDKNNPKDKDYIKNIIDRYENIKKGYEYNLSYGLKKINMSDNYIFPSYSTKLDCITHKPPPAQPSNNKRVVDIYVVRSATPIKFGEKFIGKSGPPVSAPLPTSNVERFNNFCVESTYKPPPEDLFVQPEIEEDLNNNNNTLFTANSKPFNVSVKKFEPVALQLSKCNAENLDILDIEKKNNELILQMRRKCKV